jgi:hypothetical protein
MSLSRQLRALLVCAAASLFLPGQAEADVIISIAPQYGSTENTGATARLDFSASQQGADTLLTLSVQNTTNGSVGLGATQATLVGVAFDLPGSVTVGNYDAGTSGLTQLWTGPDLPPYGTFEFGISPPRNTFAGGDPQDGLTAGQAAEVQFLLQGAQADAFEQALNDGFASGALRAVGRFQQVNPGGSDKVLGGPVPGDNNNPGGNNGNPGGAGPNGSAGDPVGVPEPSTFALLSLGGLGLAGWRRWKRRATA